MMGRLLVLLFAALPLCRAVAWEPKPWEKYVVEIEVRCDTVPQTSIMLRGVRNGKPRPFNPENFRVGAFWVPEQPSLFAEYDDKRQQERIASGDYSWGDALFDTALDILSVLF